MTQATFDLTKLGLPAGSHVVQARAKAAGYSTSASSNAVSYVVASAAAYTVKIAALGDGEVSSYKMNGNNSVDLNINYAIRTPDEATREIMEQYSTTLTDVSSLVCYVAGADTGNYVAVYDSNFNEVYKNDHNYQEFDATPYLSEGCYVLLCTNG